MMSFRKGKLAKLCVPMRVVRLIGEIDQFKGKQDLFRQQNQQLHEALMQAAVTQSTGPKNSPAGEAAGYSNVLATINTYYNAISITPGLMQQLYRDLYKFTPDGGGSWNPADNLAPDAMDELCDSFNREFEAREIHPLILTAAFILDFLCIHPFSKGNGRLALLLTLLILYKFDYQVGRYISLEKLVEKTKNSFSDILSFPRPGWREGEHNLLRWLEYFLGIILAAYREYGDRAGNINRSKGIKGRRIEKTIRRFMGDFTISDIENACPDISRPTIYRVLKELKEQGLIKVTEVGRNARWSILK